MCLLLKCQLLFIWYASPLVSLAKEPKQHQRLFVLGAIEVAVKKTVPSPGSSQFNEKIQASGKKGKDEKARINSWSHKHLDLGNR